ncbi:tyrosine-type recombinase/integrase [Microcoleus sp. T3_A4]|uniref:tyrosine-type recombinase/integrase n=1 Tax=Microcoleus sp. T3_A4 TaxID=2818968 RepID=UPI002FD3997C
MKSDRHGQAAILSPAQIELLFTEGLQSDRDRALFGVCLYTAARIAEACSLKTEDCYTTTGQVREEINIRKAATKGQVATRGIPVNPELRSLLILWQPSAGPTFLFPGRHTSHKLRHISSDSAAVILREACKKVGIEGASTHSFRRTALTQMSNSGIPLRVIQEVSGHRTLSELQKYLEVSDSQVKGAIASLSLLSYVGKPKFDELEPTSPTVPLS